MDLQRLRFAPNTYFVIAISATALMFAFCISSAVLNGDWHILEDPLSRLGISENPVAAFLFNFGCVLTGLLGVVAASGIVQYSSAMMKTAGVTIMLGMNNVIHRDYPPTYDFTADAAKYATAIVCSVSE